ncbi:MAG: pyridoxal-phosphate-dependent aminotransferase family protein [Candidatus Bathyarchaeia archaeon]
METKKLIMLPGPTNVPARVTNAMLRPMINHRGQEFREMHARIIQNAKYVFGTKNDLFVLSNSGTGGVEAAVRNICSPGSKIIVPVNGEFSRRFLEAVNLLGGKGIEIPVELGNAVTVSQVEDALKQNSPVAAVAVIYNETATGVTTPNLKQIGELCRKHNTLFLVDAISIQGGVELPVDEWGIDICVTGSQKCLMTPPGLALISVSPKAWEVIRKTPRSYYFDLQLCKQFMENSETPYTPAVTLFYALDEALQMIREEGLEARFKRHTTCANAMYAAAEAMGLQPLARREVRSKTVVAIKYPNGIEDKKFRGTLDSQYRIAVAGGMGKTKGQIFRVGIMGSVSEFEIMATATAVESVLFELGYGLTTGEAVKAAREVFSKAK